jgi:hypothetical protein
LKKKYKTDKTYISINKMESVLNKYRLTVTFTIDEKAREKAAEITQYHHKLLNHQTFSFSKFGNVLIPNFQIVSDNGTGWVSFDAEYNNSYIIKSPLEPGQLSFLREAVLNYLRHKTTLEYNSVTVSNAEITVLPRDFKQETPVYRTFYIVFWPIKLSEHKKLFEGVCDVCSDNDNSIIVADCNRRTFRFKFTSCTENQVQFTTQDLYTFDKDDYTPTHAALQCRLWDKFNLFRTKFPNSLWQIYVR